MKIKELIKELQLYPQDMDVIVHREGKDHYFEVDLSDIRIVDEPYFPNSDVNTEGKSFLMISSV